MLTAGPALLVRLRSPPGSIQEGVRCNGVSGRSHCFAAKLRQKASLETRPSNPPQYKKKEKEKETT